MQCEGSSVSVPCTESPAVFGPTNFIGTTTTTTYYYYRRVRHGTDEDFYARMNIFNVKISIEAGRKIGVTKRVTELPNLDRFDQRKTDLESGRINDYDHIVIFI